MKIWKVLNKYNKTVCYIQFKDNDKRDTMYLALEIARNNIDMELNTTQLLSKNEEINNELPYFVVDGNYDLFVSDFCRLYIDEDNKGYYADRFFGYREISTNNIYYLARIANSGREDKMLIELDKIYNKKFIAK